ncbi:MAG TPA: exopolysaccharide transport family protein, partial [Rhodoferax sp.]|nr:exopolysaccharide transport family protein [Rhodoferax sp.]
MSKSENFAVDPLVSRGLSLRQPHNLQTSVLRDEAEELDNDALDLKALFRVVLKYKWMLIALTLLCGLAATIQSLRATPMYRASVQLQIDRSAQRVVDFNRDVDAEMQMYDDGSQLQTQIELLKSRGLAERMVDEMGLDKTRPAASPMAALPQEAAASAPFGQASAAVSAQASDGPGFVDQLVSNYRQLATPSVKDAQVLGRDGVVGAFMGSVSIEPVRNTRLVNVTVVNSNAELAARIANTMAKTYIAMNLERKMETSVYAKTFLEDQIRITKAKLEESERVINDYAKRNAILVLDEKTNVASQNFADFSAGLSRVEQERIKAESLYNEVLRSPESAPQVLESKAVQAYKEQRAKLEAEYATNISVYKPDYPKMVQLKAQINELNARIKAEIAVVSASVKGQFEAAKRQEEQFRARLGETRSEVLAVQDRSVDLNLLKRELDTNRQVYDSLLQRLKQVSVTGGLTSNNISVVDEAITPLYPYSPQLTRNAAIGMGVGLLLALGLAFLRENLDDSVRHYDEIEGQYGLPLLGLIPLVKKKTGEAVALVAHQEPRSSFAEAYRSMRTALQFSTADGAPERLMVTSCGQSEAKSTTALALGINFAQLGRQVLLIDADMRNPSMHKTLKMPNEGGLSNF